MKFGNFYKLLLLIISTYYNGILKGKGTLYIHKRKYIIEAIHIIFWFLLFLFVAFKESRNKNIIPTITPQYGKQENKISTCCNSESQ